jgi:hypothetical protein
MNRALRPLLLLDVDGVLNPYPDCQESYSEYAFFPNDEEPVRLSQIHGDWLRELAGYFEMVWATGWGDDANRFLCSHFGLPELPVIALPRIPFDPSAKVAPIDAYVGDRAVAWVDDIIPAEARRWAEERAPHLTLLVEVDHAVGLKRAAVDDLIEWAVRLDRQQR